MVTINGKTYKGNNVSVINNEVFIDGKRANQTEDSKVINITIDGNIETLDVDYCDKLDITGDCKNVTSKNGNIQVKGNVSGDVTNKNGNIVCRDVGGDAKTKNYLCSQLIVQKQERVGNNNNVTMNVIIRKVIAKSNEEAIGKFIVGTKSIDAVKKLDVECFLLNELLTLN